MNECIKHGPFDNGAMRVTALWHGQPQPFGSAYTCSIKGTVVDSVSAGVPEFLVYESVLHEICTRCGLRAVPITSEPFHPGCVFHHLRPPYAGPLATCTELFAAFAFQKQ